MELVDTLSELVSWSTETSNQSNNQDAIERLGTMFAEMGYQFSYKDVEGHWSLYASLKDTDSPETMLLGHIDTVEGKRGWETNQYDLSAEGHGLGAYDMKAGIATMLKLAETKRENVAYLITSDEEQGGVHGAGVWCNEIFPRFVLIPEPTDLKVGLGNKGVLNLELNINGKSAHSSKPWEGVNALDVLTEFKTKAYDLAVFNTKTDLGKYSTIAHTISNCDNERENQAPDTCSAIFNVRYIPEIKPERVVDDLRHIMTGMKQKYKAIYSDFAMALAYPKDKIGFIPAVSMSLDNFYVKELLSTMKEVGIEPGYHLTDGASDNRWFWEKGSAVVEFGPKGEGMHAPNERVDINTLPIYYKAMESFVDKISKESV